MRTPTENKLSSSFISLAIRAMNMQLMTMIITVVVFLLATYAQDRGWFPVEVTYGITTIFGCLLHMILVYKVFWHIGERDRNLVLYHHLDETRARGLKAGIVGTLPLLVLTILYVIYCYTDNLGVGALLLIRFYALEFIWFFQKAYENTQFAWLLLLVCTYTPILCGIGYANGHRLIELLPKLLYQKKDQK